MGLFLDGYKRPKKDKKKDEKKTEVKKPQSSSASRVNERASNSTFMGGGASVKQTQKTSTASTKPRSSNQKTSTTKPSTPQPTKITKQRQATDTGTGRKTTTTRRTPTTREMLTQRQTDTGTGSKTTSTRRTPTAKEMLAQRQAEEKQRENERRRNRDANLNLKQTQAAASRRRAEPTQNATDRRKIAQAMKSGDYDRVSELRGPAKSGSLRAKYEQWDKDISDTITHTIKQGLAADARVANLGMKGITQKDDFLYTTEEQRKQADKKTEERDKRLARIIENETKAIEDAQKQHGYLGKQALSAVSSTTGMGMDIAAGAIIPGSSLFHMWARSTGTSLGEVNKKADNLRKKLKATGQYSDEELDEMFKNVDAYDMANAAASGGIEVLSELLFPGIGAARKVIGGKGMSIAERAGAKLFNRVGEKASAGLLRNIVKGTGEEVLEEEVGGPLQAWASNIIYGNRFQRYNEDAVKRSLTDQSNTLRSQIRSDDDARAAAARLNSQSFMDDSIHAYMESGISKKEATELAELSREYLSASLTGDVDAMKKYQDEMVSKLAGEDNSLKAKFGLQDAIDAAVSTSMMTLATGAPGAISTMQIGNSYKDSVGLDAVKQQAEIILNWGEEKDRSRAQAIMDHIDNGGDLSGTQVYEIVQQAAEVAAESKESEQTKNRLVQTEMRKKDLRINPFNPDDTLAPQTSRRYEQIVNDTMGRYAALSQIGEGFDFDASEVELGADIGAAFKTGVISSEQINELARGSAATKTVFEDVTGIDIKQFDSNTEMRDALMAEAAQNMVNSARLEQAAWNDEERGHMADYLSKGVGGTGDIAIQNALAAVDPRDRGKFILTGEASRRVYEYARNTNDSWDDVKHRFGEMFEGADSAALKSVFNAAKEDKAIAETAYYGKVVKSGEELKRSSVANADTAVVAGKYTDNRSNKEGDKSLAEESLLKSFVKAFGINVEVVDDLASPVMDAEGNPVLDIEGNPVYRQDNGLFDPNTNTLVVNAHPDVTRTITQTATHELTHFIAVHAPDEYVKLSRYIMDAWYKQDAEGFKREVGAIQRLYKQQKNQDLSTEQALEELIANGTADFNWGDEDFIAEVTAKEPTLASKIIDAIKEVLRKIRSILASGDVLDAASREALYDKAVEFDTVRSLWVKAAQTARQAEAQQAVDEWQDNANRYSVGYHAGDLGKSTVDDYAHQGYSRGTGHFGFGTYFVGDEEQINYGDYGKRKHETVDFDKYNLATPRDAERGFLLHDALKRIDGFIQDYSKFSKYLDPLNRTDEAWDEQYYITRRVHDDLDDITWDLYQGDEVNQDKKARVDSYVETLPQDYKDEIEEKTRDYVERNKDGNASEEYWRYEAIADVAKEYSEDWDGEYNKFLFLTMDIRKALGYKVSEAQVEEALKNTEEIVKGYGDGWRLNAEPGLDSGATVFMKQLGYEGVDVRHIKELDNTGYGSVIYDLKDEDLARKQEIGTARYSIPTTNDVLADRDDTAIYIKNTKQVNYIDLIFKGEKTEETRPMRTLDKFIGKEVAVTDGKKVYGTVVLGEPHKYSAEEFRSEEAQAKHRVPVGDTYDSENGKWAYPIESYERYDEPMKLSDSKDYLNTRQARQVRYSLNDDTNANNYAEEQLFEDSENTIQSLSESDLSIRYSFGPEGTFYEKGFHSSSGTNVTGSDVKKSKGHPLLKSGKEILAQTMKKNINAELKKQGISTRSKEAKAIVDARIEAVMNFMDAMNGFMEETGLQYTFIGMQDVYNAKISVRKTSEGIQAITMSAMVKNGEYPINFDFTTICKKRQAFNAIIEKLTDESAEGVDISLSPKELGEINNALRKEGLETACLGCFVEARRYNMQNYTNKVCELWNKCVDEYAASIGVDPADIEDFNFSNGENTTEEKFQDAADTFFAYENTAASKKNPEDRFRHIIRSSQKTYMKHLHPADLITSNGIQHIKDMSTKSKDFFGMLKSAYGVAAPKETIKYVPYNSEVALLPANKGKDKDGNTQTMLDYLKSIGGIRMQSFSDYLVANTFDYMQMVADMAARGFPAHAYTKEIAFARVFGMTGIKINLSIMYDVQNLNYWRGIFKDASDERLREIAAKYAGLQYFENADDIPEEFKDYDEDGNLILDHGSIMQIDEDGVKGYLTYLVGDENRSQRYWEEVYRQVLEETGDEAQAEEQANECRKWIQSINFKEAKELQRKKGYGTNCGMIGVGLSNANILLMLNDDNMPYIIPYHASGLPDVIKQHTGLNFATNYEDTQNTRIFVSFTKDGEELGYDYVRDLKDKLGSWQKAWDKVSEEIRNGDIVANGRTPKAATETEPAEVNKDGNPYVLHGTADFDFYAKIANGATPQEAAEMYLEYCDDYGLLPVFPQFAGHPNYYKLLVDYSVTDLSNKKATSPQGAVKNIYPGSNGTIANIDEGSTDYEGIKSILKDEFEKLNAKNKHRDEVVDKIVEEWKRKDIRHSIAADLDGPYMDAVDSGDTDEAQRLVDEAAKMAMPNTKLKGRWYHGTENEFTEFNFSQGGKNGTADGFGIYLTNDPEVASSYGNRMIEGYVNVTRPASALTSQTLTKSELRRLIKRTVDDEALQMAEDYDSNIEEAKFDTWISNYTNTRYAGNIDKAIDEVIKGITSYNGNDMDIIQEIMVGMGIRNYDEATRFYDILTEATGIDGFETKWGDESEMADPNTPTIALAFRSNQIKSADPVTYAEDGSVIPLSERFDPNKNDIRYSLPTTDADGKVLTDGQMEYFKNSQARDSQGRLVPVYHTTNKGGFTVFDPMRSDDHRSLFFASNWDVSQTYGNYANSRFYQFDINNLDDVEKYLNAYGPDFYVLTKDEFERAGGYEADFVDFENEGPQYRFDAIQKKWKSSNRASETRTFLFNSYIEDVENGDINPDDYVVIVGVPDYSPDHRSYSDTWILANSPNELVSELKNHFLAQQNTYSGASTVGTQHGYYQCYLNLENPLIIDAQGQNWNDISDPNAVKFWIRKLIGPDRKPNGLYGVMFDGPLGEYREGTPEELSDLYNGSISGLIDEYDISIGANSFTIDRNTGEQIYGESSGNTRYWAERAEAEGYDGVIFRNLLDIGGKSEFDGLDEYSDIYIAFSSNQVKDINNENPTENPDIRYSIPPKEDVLDYIASTVEDINDIPLSDAALEQSRQEQSEWHENLVRDIVSRFDEGSLTFGMYLDEASVKKHLIALMKQVMSESGTGKKYRTETLESTIESARVMFYDMKSNQIDNAAEAAWRAAQKIVDDIDYNDDLYVQYKGIRQYLDRRKIIAPEGLEYDPSFVEFVDDNKGRMRFVDSSKKGTSVDTAYKYLVKNYPQLFPADMEDPIDKLLQIDYALDYTTPYRDAYSSEEYSKLVATIAGDLMDIVSEGEAYRTVADDLTEKYEGQIKAMKVRHEEALRKVKETEKEKRDATRQTWAKIAQRWKDKYNERIQKDKEERKAKADKREHLKSFGHIEENYKKLCTWVLKPTKEKNVPEEFRKALAEFLQALDLQTENSKALEAKTGKVAQKTLKMRELKDRLNDLAARKGDDGSSVWEVDASIAFLLEKLSNKLDENGNSIDALSVDDIATIDEFMKLLIRNIQRYKQVKTETKMAELSDVGGRGVEFFKAKIDRDGTFKKKGAIQTINATALTPAYLFDRMGPLKEMYDVLRHNGFDTYIRNEKMITDRLTEILSEFYRTNRKNQNMPGSIIEEWRDERSAQTIELASGKTVTMSIAQIMTLRCLAKRGEQAMGHMMVGGIVVEPIQTTSKLTAEEKKKKGKAGAITTRTGRAVKKFVSERFKGVDESSQKYVLTYEDIQNIISRLTPKQANVADKLQELMSVDMAKLGNEAHRELYGYEMFEESDYFPIKVHGNERSTDINNIGEVVEKIKSFGFTKPLTPKAGQAIDIGDIFSIVADHCNGMNLYNAYLVPITDFMKVLNYTHTFENGDVLTMKEAIEQAYGKDMLKYILNLMKDINGIKGENRGGLEGIMNKALGTAKRTAVFGNIRVALQQPTAIVRAAAEINPKYIKGALHADSIKGFVPTVETKTMEEMWKYCPIAQWKAWGYYDTYMGRDIEDVMMNTWSIGDKFLAGYYGQLDNATWSIIWQAVKAEQAEKYPEMDHNSEEFLQICGRRASEVFDKTQVVDSTFHRSDSMRSKQVAVKVFTAFMAEPTLTLNVFRAGLFNANEAKKAGNKAEARKIMAKAIAVIGVQAIVVSAAQAFADAWRGKDPGLPWDDDDDEEKIGYWWRWIHNFTYNLFDQAHLENNMYLVKDVTPYINYMISKGADYADYKLEEGGHEKASDTLDILRAIMGWDQDYLYSQNNLVFAGLENTANGIAQAFKKLEKGDEYVDYNTKEPKSWYDINQKVASGIGTFTGFPAGTLMRDLKPVWDFVIQKAFAADTELMDNIANKMGYQKIGSGSTDNSSSSTSESEGTSYSMTEDDLPDNLTDEQKKDILKAGEKRAKKAESEEAQEQLNYDKMLYDAMKAAAGLEGEEYNKKVYSSVAQGLKGYIADGDYTSIGMMRTVIEQAGGDVAYFDQRVMEETKSAYKKTLVYAGDMYSPEGLEARNNQKAMFRYMMNHGMTQEELSSEVLYHSELAKDMKVAYRVGDNDLIYEAMLPLVDAGITELDLQRLYENRNKMDLTKYKQNGRFKDKLKSMGTFIWPTEGVITSHFGYRNAPTAGASSNHPAIDIGAPMGTAVVAADGGVVISAGANGGYGNSVGIKHDNGMITWYNHLSAWNVKVGDTVGQGQQIAQVGSTGISTGPHLDFKIVDAKGNPVDPEKYLNKR